MVGVREAERDDCRRLQRCGCPDGQEIVDAPDPDRQVGRGDRPADPPAGDREVFDIEWIETVRSAIPECRERDVLALEHDVLVDVVGEGERIELDAQRGDQVEFVAAVDLAGRVVRRVDDDRPGPRPERSAQLVGIDRPVRLMERHERGTAPARSVGAGVS